MAPKVDVLFLRRPSRTADDLGTVADDLGTVADDLGTVADDLGTVDEQVFCTTSDTRVAAGACTSGSAVVSGFSVVWSCTHAGRIVFVTADGYLRMIDDAGQLVWRPPNPIAGASFPLLLPALSLLYLASTDGSLHQLSLTTGTQTAVQPVGDGTATVGSPAYDTFAQQLYAACSDGKLYRYAVPF